LEEVSIDSVGWLVFMDMDYIGWAWIFKKN